MATTDSKDDVTVTFHGLTLAGQLIHDRAAGVLELETDEGPEQLSTDLSVYGLPTGLGDVWIKDWTEHEGLAQGLVEQGLGEIIGTAEVGPFASRAHLVKVLID